MDTLELNMYHNECSPVLHILIIAHSYIAGSHRHVLLLAHKRPLSLTATGEFGGHGW